MSTTLNMSMNSISHTNPAPSSYTLPKTSRFLAFGKLNPKYPAELGKSVPSTFSGWPKFTHEVPQPTLSPLAFLSLPHTASGSYASESTLGSMENSPLQPKSSLLAHQKKLVVDEKVSAGDDPLELEAGSLQLENNLPLNLVQESALTIPYFIFPPIPKGRNPTWISPLLCHTGFVYSGSMLRWNMMKPFDTIRVPDDSCYKYIDFTCMPAFRPDLPQINVSIGQLPAYKATFNALRTVIDDDGDLLFSVAQFLKMTEILLAQPLEETHWKDISISNKIILLYTMAVRLRVSVPLYIAEFREKALCGEASCSEIDAFQMEALQGTADSFARDHYTGRLRVIGKDYLGEQTMFHGIEWDNHLKEFIIITRRPPGCQF